MKNYTNIAIIGGSILIVGAMMYFFLRPKGSEVKKVGELIISKPKGKMKQKVIIIWGGISYATPDWVLEQIPLKVKNNYLLVIAPYTMSLDSINSTILPYFSNNNINISQYSLAGFSAGAKKVLGAYSENYDKVGLIDPSTNSTLSKQNFGNNVIMTYNPKNWGSYPNIKKAFPILANNILKGGGKVENKDMKHKNFVKYYFEKYY